MTRFECLKNYLKCLELPGPAISPFPIRSVQLNEVSGPRLQLGAQYFEQLVSGVPVDLSYSNADYGATDYGNPSSDAGLSRYSGTSGDGDRTLSEEPDMVGSLCIPDSEDNENQPEDDGGDDDEDGDGHCDEDEPILVAYASSSGGRPAPGKRKGLTNNFMPVMSKIVVSRQKRGRKQRITVGSKEVRLMEVHWIQSLSLRTVSILPERSILKTWSRFVSLTGWTPSDPAVTELARETGLSHLRSCMCQHPNSSLLSAFVERIWHKFQNPLVVDFLQSLGPSVTSSIYLAVQSSPVRVVIMSLGSSGRSGGCWFCLDILVFPMFAPAVKPGTKLYKVVYPEVVMLGHKIEHKLIDISRRGQVDCVQVRGDN
ncbi:hypothetical protein M9H77_23752 [Catharanthus roseus]|uniref:Uncharacterized protein n=1 Tax=Catharanthus roseus TaxID=4058 RepID=A0ACC0AV61_CATRO|nr:hypothetical protein M9H77_23752 [Catharanthus roseus]